MFPYSTISRINNAGVIYSTNRRVWEHDNKFKKYLRKIRVMGIDMETATIFITSDENSGSLHINAHHSDFAKVFFEFIIMFPYSTISRINNAGVIYSTNRRVWEHDNKFKKYLRKIRVMGIDMETATIFITGFSNEINRGALLLVSDTPMIPEGIKTEEKDKDVTQKYADLHIDMGIEAMTKIGDEGEKIKHFKY